MTQLNGKHFQNSLLSKQIPRQATDTSQRRNARETPPEFDQPVMLKRSPMLSRAVLWSLVGFTTFTFIWAAVAKIEEAIPAQGKLEPKDAVNEVQVPVNGVVKQVFVKDGQEVKKGDLLMVLDPTSVTSQLISQKKVRNALLRENQFYYTVTRGGVNLSAPGLEIPQELAKLAESRTALEAENRLYRAQLTGNAKQANLDTEQEMRLRSSQEELRSRAAQIRLETDRLRRELAQNQARLNNSKKTLAINQSILNDLEPLMKQGAIAKLQYRQRQQEVNDSQTQVIELTEEVQRLKLGISQSQQRLKNTISGSFQELLDKIAQNEKSIAEIDSRLNKVIIDNQNQIAEIESQISQAQVTLKYQEVRSPNDGTIFDLKASKGFVTNPSEPVVKVVPDQRLVAEVFLTNKDIGFVREGMPVDVRFTSYNYSEFGDVKGELISIGKDALPPNETRPYYTFPAKVRLNEQALNNNGEMLPLQSGMEVQANIKVRDRSVLSIFADKFIEQIESLKFVR